jgi:hypothetical protein
VRDSKTVDSSAWSVRGGRVWRPPSLFQRLDRLLSWEDIRGEPCWGSRPRPSKDHLRFSRVAHWSSAQPAGPALKELARRGRARSARPGSVRGRPGRGPPQSWRGRLGSPAEGCPVALRTRWGRPLSHTPQAASQPTYTGASAYPSYAQPALPAGRNATGLSSI